MAEEGWRAGVDSAMLVSGATAFFFLLGFAYTTVQYGQLGIPEGSLGFDLPFFMFQSAAPVSDALPILALVAFVNFLSGQIARRRHRHLHLKGTEAWGWNPISVVVLGSVLVFLRAFVRSKAFWADLDWWAEGGIDVALFAGAAGYLIFQASRKGPRRGHRMDWYRGFLGFTAVVLLVGAASLSGSTAGNSAADLCEPVQVIHFTPTPPGLDANKTYWLILHQGGNFHVRDTALRQGDKTHITIPESSVQSAVVEGARKLRHDC